VSPSWIERLRRGLAPSARAGLAVGRDYVGFAELAAADGGWRVTGLAETKLDAPLFSGAPAAEAADALRKGLGELAGRVKGRYLPVHVSVPDALVRWATFDLDELPRARAAQLDLVRFRFARQGINGAHVVACQALAHDGDKQVLFGMATDGAWQRLVNGVLADAGIEAWSLSANACRTFNRFHDRLTRSSGALVALAPDAWSLWLWDDGGRPRHGRGRWRTGAGDHADIALEVERSILAYVHGGRERSVARVFVAGGADAVPLAEALDARLRERCVRLPADEGAAAGGSIDGVASAAVSLAAALER
jgi:hypothetical protein